MPKGSSRDLPRNKLAAFPAMASMAKALPQPAEGWLRSTRLALGLPQGQVAAKIGIKRQAYANFETGEVRSTISLASLRRAARAMDCDLVYYLVPQNAAPVEPFTPPAPPAPPRASATEHFVVQAERSADELRVELL